MTSLMKGKFLNVETQGPLAIVNLDLEGQKVNKLSGSALGELEEAVTRIQAEPSVKAVLIRSRKKKSFVVGADVEVIRSLKDKSQAVEAAARGHVVFNMLEDLRIPTLAAIEGPCMGGGTELALAARYRICSDDEKTVIALPEIKLGFVPGWGGTYRLPKLVGLPNALDMMLTGKSIRPAKAEKMGLVDRMVPSAIFDEEALRLAGELAAGKKPFRPRAVSLQEKAMNSFVGRKVVLAQAGKQVAKSTQGHYPAPVALLELIADHGGASRDKYGRKEAEAFAKLWETNVSKSLVNLFFMVEDNKRSTGSTLSMDEVAKLPQWKQVAVLGAGVMGGGIGAQAAASGFRATMKDIQSSAVAAGLAHARKIFQKDFESKRFDKYELTRRMDRVRGQLDYTGFQAMDLVIEAVVENLDVKKKVFTELEQHIRPDCVVATNTSSLRMKDMAPAFKDASRFVGLHFFNPVEKMPLVEVIKLPGTRQEIVAQAVQWVKNIGKTPVVTADGPGFLVNRLLLPWLNEAGYCLMEGHEIETLDRALTKFGMPMGPCRLLDEIGLDVAAKVGHILHDSLGEHFKPSEAMDLVVAYSLAHKDEKPVYGKKTGRGFYKWDKPGGRTQGEDVELMDRIFFKGATRPTPKKASDETLVKRMVYPMINEAAVVLAEKIVDSPADVDLGMIFGTGFPPFRGGLLRYADTVGVANIVKDLEAFARDYGVRFSPSKALQHYAAKGRFYP